MFRYDSETYLKPAIESPAPKAGPWAVWNRRYLSPAELDRAERAHVEVLKMVNPVDLRVSLGRFGLLLGTLPPAAIFYKIITLFGVQNSPAFLIIATLMLGVTLFVGKYLGMALAPTVAGIGRLRWTSRLVCSIGIGIVWGLVTGGSSGLFAFVIGLPVGAIIGASVGSVAFPIFVSLHKFLSNDGKIESSLLHPIAFGIAAVFAGFVLGL